MQRRADRQALLEACARVEDGIEALSRMSPLSCFTTVASDLSAIVGGPELLECAGVGEDPRAGSRRATLYSLSAGETRTLTIVEK